MKQNETTENHLKQATATSLKAEDNKKTTYLTQTNTFLNTSKTKLTQFRRTKWI